MIGAGRLFAVAVAGLVVLLLWLVVPPAPLDPGAPAPRPPDAPPAPALPAPPAPAPAAEAPTEERPVPVIRVVGEDGAPVAGATVRTPDHVLGETEADGTLHPRRWRWYPGRDDEVWAVAPARASPAARWSGEPIELRLAPAATVSGLVTDAAGAPAAGVAVSLYGELHTFTDEEGRYRVSGIRPGPLRIAASFDGNRGDAMVEVPAGDGEIEADLRLAKPLDATDVRLDVHFSRPPAATPRLSSWRGDIDLPRADSLVRLRAPDEDATAEVVCPGFRTATAVVRPGDERVALRLEAGGGMPERIVVVDAAGRPVPEAMLLVTSGEHDPIPSARSTDGAGEYRLSARERGILVVASAAAGASERAKVEEGADEVRLVLGAGGAVEGRVVDRATGEGVAGVRVLLSGGECRCCSFWSATTDGGGGWRIAGLPAGGFVRPWVQGDVSLDGCPNETPSRLQALRIGAGAAVRTGETIRLADLLVDRYETADCRVVTDPPLPETEVGVVTLAGGESDPSVMEKRPDGSLDFTFRAGPRVLVITAWRLRGLLRLDLPPGEGRREIRLPLDEVAEVSLRLVLADGKPYPVRGVPLLVATADGVSGATARSRRLTDENGRIDATEELLPLAGLVFLVSLADDARESLTGGPLRITGEEVAARLRAAGGGDVTIPVTVTAAPAGSTHGGRPAFYRVVDEAGRPLPGIAFEVPEDPDDRGVSDADGLVPAGFEDPLPPWCGRRDGDRIVVSPGRRVRLRLVDEAGAALAGAVLHVDDGWLPCTDGEGRVQAWFPVGLETLAARCDEGWIAPIRLPAGEEEAVVTVRPWWRPEVVVTGPPALAVEPEVRISWRSGTSPGSPEGFGEEDAGADGGGFRTRLTLPPAPAVIVARSSDLRYGAEIHVAPGAERIELRLVPRPEQDVVLVLLDAAGRPLANARVTARPARYTTGAIFPADARTDGEGRLTLGLPAGEHRIDDLEAAGRRFPEIRFTSPSPEPVEVRLPAR